MITHCLRHLNDDSILCWRPISLLKFRTKVIFKSLPALLTSSINIHLSCYFGPNNLILDVCNNSDKYLGSAPTIITILFLIPFHLIIEEAFHLLLLSRASY